jgi:8-amino-7-oxononanoate synthase
MAGLLARYADHLAALDRKGRRRALMPQAGLDFSSNDYLGLAASAELAAAVAAALARGVPPGAGGSRLLRGNHAEHEALEAEAAELFGAKRMLYFAGGYVANLALFSTLPQGGDLIINDALIHASVHAGLQGSRATLRTTPHNDPGAVEAAIRDWRAEGGTGRVWIAAESLYSMDGDQAPLTDLAAIADRHDAFLIIDEAHATGVHGPAGRGLAAGLEGRENVIVVHTCGKALGSAGALIGADPVLCDYLVNRARPFIYATAPSPLQAATVRAGLGIMRAQPERRAALRDRIALANAALAGRLGRATSGTQIIPVPVGDNDRARRIAARLQSDGFDIRAIRPPTVPIGTARLRISVTLNTSATDIGCMADAVAGALDEDRP